MSILQEYEQIRRIMGDNKFDSIELYLKNHPNILLSDILYKPKNYIDYGKWYNEKILKRTVKIVSIYDTDYQDVKCNAILYINRKPIANIIGSYDEQEMKFKCNNDYNYFKEALKISVLDDFDKYINLPKVSSCSKLLQKIYDTVCESEASMCHITDEDWQEDYQDDFTLKDIDYLKEEVDKLGLEDVITFNDSEYKILGWGDLETRLNDDRYLLKYKDKARE